MANPFDIEQERPECDTIAQLAHNIVYRVPGCSDMMVRQTLVEAYAEFCDLTNALTTDRSIALEAGRGSYPVVYMIPDCRIQYVKSVRVRGKLLTPERDYHILPGVTPGIMLDERLLPAEGEELAMLVTCIEMPKTGSEQAPQWFIRKHGSAIAAGALARLFGMTGRPWADATQMRLELARWERGLSNARLGYMCGSQFGNGKINSIDTSDIL